MVKTFLKLEQDTATKKGLFSSNNVTGYDGNSNLGRRIGIEIIAGKADEIEKVDRMFTEF